MFLSRLDLHGFKSFADKTTLAFSAGVTCIVGPNGSGKSNVVDAVRWVIGEQRARVLRSDAMASVLFNGSKSRKPLGLADVRLTVENTRGVLPSAYTEVTVGRRLYRSGESEYLLNGVECRLRDVQDLFLDTGLGAGAYSIIELSMVEDLLSEADEDRRRLFEEAAGVTRYKLRRKQALARLDATRHDLARVRDLDGELAARVASLRRQADRAARHRDLSARLERLDDLLAHAEHARLTAEHDAAAERLRGLDTDLASADARLAALDTAAAAAALARTRAETARLDARQALDAHLRRVRDLDAEHRLADERLARARADAARVRAEHDEATRRRAAVAGAAHRVERDTADAAPDAAQSANALRSATATRDAARAALDAARQSARAAQADEARASAARQNAERDRDRAATRRDLLAADLARLDAASTDAPPVDPAARARAEAARQSALADADAARQNLDAADALRLRLDADTAVLARERRGADARLATLDAEARVLRRLVEQQTDRAGAVRSLAAAPGIAHHAGVLVTVADVLRPDSEASGAALRAILGPALGDLVAATTAEADALLAHLRANGAGQATVHVLELIGDAPDDRRQTTDDDASEPVRTRRPDRFARGDNQHLPPNDQPLAARVAAAAPRYEPLRDALLRGVWLVDDAVAAAARAAATPGHVFVAPDGTWAAGARRHGGSATPGEAAPSRLDQLARLDALTAESDAARAALDILDRRQSDLDRERPATDAAPHRRALDQSARALRDADAALARLDADARSAARMSADRAARRDALAAEIARLDAALPALDAPLADAAAALDAARAARQRADAALPAAERAADAASAAERDAARRDADARRRLDQLARDAERTATTLRDLDRQQTARTADIARLDAQSLAATDALRAARAALDAAAPDRQGLEDAAQSADAALLNADAAASEHDVRLRDARRAREAALLAVQDTRARHAALAEQRTALLVRLADERGAPFDPDALTGDPDLDAFDASAARAERADVRRRLDSLGAVNALALDDFESESARLDTLRVQLADLEAAEATLGQTIDELNAEASRRFRETFVEIQASFARLFADLFGEGAAAEVRLADPRAPLESAIEITARPAGKRPAAITQLSGGEKTLTAIALLFAIYLVKPSPFCLLDEVDAPLDEANVDRFMALLRRFAGETQFLVITHNKRTMELADRLYGVTMQEPGVSTVVSVDFERAAGMAG